MLNVLLFDVILPSSQSSEIWNWAAELRNLGWIDWGFWFAFVVPKFNTYTYMRKYTFVSVSWAIYVYVYIAPFNIYNCILTLRTIIRRYIYKNTNYFPVGPNVLGLGLYSGMGCMKFEKKGKGVAASLRFESPAVILIKTAKLPLVPWCNNKLELSHSHQDNSRLNVFQQKPQ